MKFQAFAEQLTKETQDLKVKIDGHKRENRRLATIIDQQKDDASRMSVRLTGTEKQRDDALEALVLQQEIAEELERDRKRNKKELAALQHTNMAILRQRDEARRVVLHLRSLIGGQSHHMEHLVQSLSNPAGIEEEIANGFIEAAEKEDPSMSSIDKERLLKAARNSQRFSQNSFSDVADRHLKDKTDAIAHIIRNIAEQCQAAVEGLQLAHDADGETSSLNRRRSSNLTSEDGHSTTTSDVLDGVHQSGRTSSIPPTPDLIPNRSSTSMSISSSVNTPERASQQYTIGHELPTKIVEDDDEDAYAERSDSDVQQQDVVVGKHANTLIQRPSGARISALGGTH